ncbi:hypothetical protein H1Q63_30920 [Desmonostoc muscorum CCALA 125]|nr:hypothetical protein [Desmonostoc muscorum CCALA 125]
MSYDDIIWKAQEIPQLCSPQIVSEAQVYVKAVKNKIERIDFIVQRFSALDGTRPTNFESTALRSCELEVEIYVESIAANLHSLADVLAHIINVIVLKPLQAESDYLESKKINISSVKDKLKNFSSLHSARQIYIDDTVQKIDNLINSREFSYIAAFVNTIKHHSLLDISLQIRLSGNLVDAGYRLECFSYRDKNFPQTECREVVMNYRKKVIDLVCDIGNSINNYCRLVSMYV